MFAYDLDGLGVVQPKEVRELEQRVKKLEDTLRMLGVGICQNFDIADMVQKHEIYPVRKLGDTRIVKVLCPGCKTYHTCMITDENKQDVKHGHWTKCSDEELKSSWICGVRCSVCGNPAPTVYGSYCSICGAKMDEEEGEKKDETRKMD